VNEAETRAELVDPALKAAGWGVVEASRVRREVITLGRLQGAGTRAAQDIADYVLTCRNHKLAVIEAKRRDLPDTEGLGQAKKYAQKLQTRFAYSTNGVGIYECDMQTGAEQYVKNIPRRTNSGTGFLPRKASGGTVSRPCRSRTGAATGRRATTRTSPSGACWKRSPRGETASC
jgi:type I site-specific restriction endonuclease